MHALIRLAAAVLLGATLSQGVVSAQGLVNPDTERKIDALIAQMTLEEKVGQLNQYTSNFDLTGPAPAEADRQGALRADEEGPRRLHVQRGGGGGHAEGAAARGGEQPAQDSDDLRPRRHPRLPHHVPDPSRGDRKLGHGRDRAVRSRVRHGGGGRGHPLDVRPHGGHRPRRAVGPHHGGSGRGPVPGSADGRGPGARLPGPGPLRPRHHRRLRQALRRATASRRGAATTTR